MPTSSKMKSALGALLEENLSAAEWEWLSEKTTAAPLPLMTAFVAVPRFLRRRPLGVSAERAERLAGQLPGFSVRDWSTVRLSRVWLLLSLDSGDEAAYVGHIQTLFDTAEMNELVALYSALPLLAYPDRWLFRATEAVRSNVGPVFDALVLNNPYPARYFGDDAWNQLVLKTIFNDKPIHRIVGLEERTNAELVRILSDFAHERWAAGRSVAPEVWRLVPAFMDEEVINDMEHLFASPDPNDRRAAALACYRSGHSAALALLARHPDLEKAVDRRQISWADLEFRDLNTYEQR